MDKQRLKMEQREMRRLLPGFRLYADISEPRGSWERYSWEGIAPTGHLLQAQYPEDYPFSQLRVTVSPDVRTHHKLGKSLCVMKPAEWSPNYTAATNILIAFRFLEEFEMGLVRE